MLRERGKTRIDRSETDSLNRQPVDKRSLRSVHVRVAHLEHALESLIDLRGRIQERSDQHAPTQSAINLHKTLNISPR